MYEYIYVYIISYYRFVTDSLHMGLINLIDDEAKYEHLILEMNTMHYKVRNNEIQSNYF